MSLTALGWFLVVCLIALLSAIAVLLRSWGGRREHIDLETCKARLADIGTRQRQGELSDSEADAARLALLAPRRTSGPGLYPNLSNRASPLIAPVATCLLVAVIGAATFYLRQPIEASGSVAGDSHALQHSGSTGDALARLADYASTIGSEKPASAAPAGMTLPDVDTMIARLAARLESTPGDIAGWQLLGWSYVHTARYEQAASAFAKAVELDPNSAELKSAYADAKAKASGQGGNSESAPLAATAAAGVDVSGVNGPLGAKPEAAPPNAQDAQIRAMVDRLADRLETSPRDVDGWTRLMRSRVVLGEKDLAYIALRRARDIFKDDSAAASKITAAATELGLKSE